MAFSASPRPVDSRSLRWRAAAAAAVFVVVAAFASTAARQRDAGNVEKFSKNNGIKIVVRRAYQGDKADVHAIFFLDKEDVAISSTETSAVVDRPHRYTGDFDLYLVDSEKKEKKEKANAEFQCSRGGATVAGQNLVDDRSQYEVVLTCPFVDTGLTGPLTVSTIVDGKVMASAEMEVVPAFEGTRSGLSVCHPTVQGTSFHVDIINSWARHWIVKGGANRVYVYDWKDSRGTSPLEITIDQPYSDRVTVEDMSQYPILHTGFGAQETVIGDCFHRAKAAGAKWVAFGDADEYVYLNSPDPTDTVLSFIEKKEQANPAIADICMTNWYHDYKHCTEEVTVNPRALPLDKMVYRSVGGAIHGRPKNILKVGAIDTWVAIHRSVARKTIGVTYTPSLNELYNRHFGGIQSAKFKDACTATMPSDTAVSTEAELTVADTRIAASKYAFR